MVPCPLLGPCKELAAFGRDFQDQFGGEQPGEDVPVGGEQLLIVKERNTLSIDASEILHTS